jgi:hypothetical protein
MISSKWNETGDVDASLDLGSGSGSCYDETAPSSCLANDSENATEKTGDEGYDFGSANETARFSGVDYENALVIL